MKKLIVRVHGMQVSPKFNIPKFDRDDPYIEQKRKETGMEPGTLLDTLAPCRTDALIEETNRNGMILTSVVQIMAGPKKNTSVLYLSYSDEGNAFQPQFNCPDDELSEVQQRFTTWVENILLRSWESGQLYQNADSLSVCVVCAMKLSSAHLPMYMGNLLDEPEQQSAGA